MNPQEYVLYTKSIAIYADSAYLIIYSVQLSVVVYRLHQKGCLKKLDKSSVILMLAFLLSMTMRVGGYFISELQYFFILSLSTLCSFIIWVLFTMFIIQMWTVKVKIQSENYYTRNKKIVYIKIISFLFIVAILIDFISYTAINFINLLGYYQYQ